MFETLIEIDGPALAARYGNAKKADLAAACERICAGDFIGEVGTKAAARTWLPAAMRFDAVAASAVSLLAHELTHWSDAKTRLDRDLSGWFGSESYAMEELVAELGAAFIGGNLGPPCKLRCDHAPYIASSLRVLKGDSRAIFTATSKAQSAADCLARLNCPLRRGRS